ncbi:hypothetical protein L3Q82_009515, partial [Scortum barcoo]
MYGAVLERVSQGLRVQSNFDTIVKGPAEDVLFDSSFKPSVFSSQNMYVSPGGVGSNPTSDSQTFTSTYIILHRKLTQLSVPAPTCQWITDLLTNRRQQVRPGSVISGTRTLVWHLLLFSLNTNHCTSVLFDSSFKPSVLQSLHMTQRSLASSGTNNLKLNALKIGLQREPPLVFHAEERCVCCGNLQVPGTRILPGPEGGVQLRHHRKGPAEDVLFDSSFKP